MILTLTMRERKEGNRNSLISGGVGCPQQYSYWEREVIMRDKQEGKRNSLTRSELGDDNP